MSVFTGYPFINGFSQVGSYPIQSNERAPDEFGSVQNFRMYMSPNVPVSPYSSQLGNTVASTIIMGAKPYAGAFLDGNNLTTLYRPPEYSNAYGLQVSLSCSLYFGCGVTQETWLVNVLCTGTAQSVSF